MKKLKRILSVFLIGVFCFTATSCGNDFYYADFSCFNTNVHIETYGKKLDQNTLEEIKELCFYLDECFDFDGENSISTMLKNAEINQKIRITPECFTLLKKSVDINEFSDGAFNPLITPLTELWGFKNKTLPQNSIPHQSEIDKILNSGEIDISNLTLEDGEMAKKKDISLDLGGLVKGYASQKVLAILKDNGFKKCYVNMGSSSLSLIGMQSLYVNNPIKETQNILYVNIDSKKDNHVSTSGDYENYFEIDGKRYSHLIDPLTGYPSDTGVRSATVILSDGTFADGITTALCLKDYHPENPMESPLVLLMQKTLTLYPEAQIYVVYQKGDIKRLITNKEKDIDFTLMDDSFTIVNI